MDSRVIRAGRHVDMVQVTPVDYPRLHQFVNENASSATWRFRGRMIPADQLERAVLAECAASLIAIDRKTGAPAALVQLGDHRAAEGHGQLHVLTGDHFVRSGYGVEACLLFLDCVFTTLGLRRVYLTVSEDALDLIGPLTDVGTVEGVLHEHVFIGGRLQDVTIVAMTKAQFVDLISRPGLALLSPDGWLSTSAQTSERGAA